MRSRPRLVLIPIFLMFSVLAYGQAWSGILAPTRGIDWTSAGVPGGIPSRTTVCATIPAGAATSTIQTAINNCTANQVVLFSAGNYTLTSSIHANKGIVLRGAGPTQTKITLNAGTNILLGMGTSGMGTVPSTLGSTNWTGGFTKGSTVLTLTSTTGISAGQNIVLDQHNQAWVYVTGVEGVCISGNTCGRNDSPLGFTPPSDTRAQEEIVHVVSVDSPTQITIAAPGVSFDHSSSLAPQAFYWAGGNIQFAGIESMSINANNNDFAVSFPFCDYCWVKNVAVSNTARGGIFFFWSYRDEVRDSYISSINQPGGPTEYGVELLNDTFTKVENNIFFGITSNVLVEGSYGVVLGYNYTLNTSTGNQFAAIDTHLSHNFLQLWEGNVTSGFGYDNSWGSASHMTSFRNYSSGNSPNKTNFHMPFQINAQNHYMNLVGNVFGDPTFHGRYQCDNVNSSTADDMIYNLGFWNSCEIGIDSLNPYDTVTLSSLMRWGNWDAVTWKANGNTNGVRWCTGSGAGNPACTAPETASTDPTFPGLASPTTTLPASFYTGMTVAHASCTTGLSFWKNPSTGACPPYPPIGPDVTCTTNCSANTANHAAMIPAQLCYANTAKDANGFLTAFDANACYANDPSGPRPAPPTGLAVKVQ